MKIHSIDNDVVLELVRGSFDDPVDIDLSVKGNGFSGSNYNIFPQNTVSFLVELSNLESSRKGKAVLSGTEGFNLTLESIGSIGEISVALELERFVSSNSSLGLRTYEYKLVLGFPVAGENVGSVITGLRQILRQGGAQDYDA